MKPRVLNRSAQSRMFIINRPADEAQRGQLLRAEAFWQDRATTLPGCEHLADNAAVAMLCAQHPKTLARCRDCADIHVAKAHGGLPPVTVTGTIDAEGTTPSGRGWWCLGVVNVIVASGPTDAP